MTEPEPGIDTEFTLPVPTGGPSAGAAGLVLIHPPGPGAGRRHPRAGASVVIGRGDGCDIRLDATAVSRCHARINPTDGGHAVRDLGSPNGTGVNDERVHERRPGTATPSGSGTTCSGTWPAATSRPSTTNTCTG